MCRQQHDGAVAPQHVIACRRELGRGRATRAGQRVPHIPGVLVQIAARRDDEHGRRSVRSENRVTRVIAGNSPGVIHGHRRGACGPDTWKDNVRGTVCADGDGRGSGRPSLDGESRVDVARPWAVVMNRRDDPIALSANGLDGEVIRPSTDILRYVLHDIFHIDANRGRDRRAMIRVPSARL